MRIYARDDINDGMTTIQDSITAYADDKIAAFNTQATLVNNYFRRGLTELKDLTAVFNAMNVHFISGITVAGTTATPNTFDLTVYDNTFDHFQYDVGQLSEYAPTYQSATYGYPTSPSVPVVTKTVTHHHHPSDQSQGYGYDPYSQQQQSSYDQYNQ